jgi:hypothetical protein
VSKIGRSIRIITTGIKRGSRTDDVRMSKEPGMRTGDGRRGPRTRKLEPGENISDAMPCRS